MFVVAGSAVVGGGFFVVAACSFFASFGSSSDLVSFMKRLPFHPPSL